MRKTIGKRGEDIAANYLQKQGYDILARNFRTGYGELDIICCKGKAIIFVEVKTRRSISHGFPEESVTLSKQERIKKTASYYLNNCRQFYPEIRFDVISVLIEKPNINLKHIISAF